MYSKCVECISNILIYTKYAACNTDYAYQILPVTNITNIVTNIACSKYYMEPILHVTNITFNF